MREQPFRTRALRQSKSGDCGLSAVYLIQGLGLCLWWQQGNEKKKAFCVALVKREAADYHVLAGTVGNFKVFRYSFSETIPMFFNRLKRDFIPV